MEGRSTVKTILLLALLSAAPCFAQSELGSASASGSIPTNRDRGAELRARESPIVQLYSTQINQLKITPMQYLSNLESLSKADAKALSLNKTGASAMSFNDTDSDANRSTSGARTTHPTVTESRMLELARELLVAYEISEAQNVPLKEIIKARTQNVRLDYALAAVLQKNSRVYAKSAGNVETFAPRTQSLQQSPVEVSRTVKEASESLGFQYSPELGQVLEKPATRPQN